MRCMDKDCGCVARGIWHELGQPNNEAVWVITGEPLEKKSRDIDELMKEENEKAQRTD